MKKFRVDQGANDYYEVEIIIAEDEISAREKYKKLYPDATFIECREIEGINKKDDIK